MARCLALVDAAASGWPLAGEAAPAESGERPLIRHAGLPQSLLLLDLAPCPLGPRSEYAVQPSHLESLPLQCLLDLPDLALAQVLSRVPAVLIGVLIRRLLG